MTAILPPELEREIFEIVASAGTTFIPPLLRVARRVKSWLEPLLYQTIVVRNNTLHLSKDLRTMAVLAPNTVASFIEPRPRHFFHEQVRHLYLDCRVFLPSEVQRRDLMLGVFTAATDVYLINVRDGPSLRAALSRMPLKRLHANLSSLFGNDMDPETSPEVDFSAAVFSNITHLGVFDNLVFSTSDWTAGLSLLPCLTHLSFEAGEPHTLFEEVFDICPLLQVFVILADVDVGSSSWSSLKAHRRVVLMERHTQIFVDWYRGARGLYADYWAQAESVIRSRRG
ncbi:hypothetical protein C8R45DRAFT_1018805 [Mycena sanguinolenta]|nr:hypothetical protein C8R45DRAFT_1018805 [Mycena sanguinolenta]